MIVLYDDGGGITQQSVDYFRAKQHCLGMVLDVHISFYRTFPMEITGANAVMLLSGVNCGYSGEGTEGSISILRMLGLRNQTIIEVVRLKRNVKISFRGGQPQLEGAT